jgi:hypothetical protein
MKTFGSLFALVTISVLLSTAQAEDFSVVARRFSDPNHPQMLTWKFDCNLPTDAGNPRIELNYEFWDPKVEGDAYSIKQLVSVPLRKPQATLSLVVLLSSKQSLIIFGGREFRGEGTPFLSNKGINISENPKLDSGTGGFMLAFKPLRRAASQVSSYFDLESWVLLTITFHPN